MIKRIYLDTKDWIDLLKVEKGLEKDSELIEVHQKIKNLANSGGAIFPISLQHLEDFMIREDDESRNGLIDLIMSISKGWVLQPFVSYFQKEVINAACHRLGKDSPYDIKSKILAKGIMHLVSPGYDIDAPGIPDELIKKLKEEADRPEAMAYFLKEKEFSEKFREERKMVEDANVAMENNRKEKMNMKKEDRFNASRAYYIDEVIGPHLALFLTGTNNEFKDKIIPKTKEDFENFIKDMPSINISFQLSYGRDEWFQRETKITDIADINHLAGAIPYCDIVVMEKAFGSLSKQLGLDKMYGCTILLSLKELNKIL